MTGAPLLLRPSLLPLLFLGVGLNTMAQSPAELVSKYSQTWPDQGQVYLKLNTTIKIVNTSAGPTATKQVERELLTLKPSAGFTDREEVSYSGLIPLAEINAWTLVPKGDGSRKITVSTFVHKDELDGQIFHDDSRSVQFIFPGVTVGAITHVDHTLNYPDARMVSSHFFATGYPVEESVFTVICDKSLEVEGKPFHVPEGALQYEREEKRGQVIQRWTMSKVAPIKVESNAPSILYYAPHMALIIRKAGELPSGDIDRLYAWDIEHVNKLLPDNDTMLVRITKEQTEGLTDDRAKAAKLYAWVQDHIKYVAVEDGMNGLIPADAVKVCEARYGDCKGMANLLRALMTNAGLTAHLTWVGSRNIPYTYDQLPTPSTDDHMVTAWDMGDSLMILDPTSDELPFGMPSAFIQGKQAMVGIDDRHNTLVEVPKMSSDKSTITDSISMKLDGTTLVGTGSAYFTGYRRSEMTQILRYSDPSKWKDVIRGIHMKGNNRYRIDSLRVDGLQERGSPLVIHYNFTIPGFANELGDEMYVPPVLEKPFSSSYYRKGRTLPVEEDFRWEYNEVVRFELPANMQIELIPKDAEHEADDSGYALRYTKDADNTDSPGTVQLKNHYQMGKLMLQLNELDAWRAMLDQLDQDMNRSIILKHKTP